MKNSLKRTTLLVSLALLAPTLARPVHAEDFVFDSHTAINGIMPSYSEKGSNDIKSFSNPESIDAVISILQRAKYINFTSKNEPQKTE